MFSLGVILFELLEGNRPFPDRDGSLNQAVNQLVHDRRSIQPRLQRNQVPHAVNRIVRKCLADDLSQRYASAAELRDDLLAHLRQLPLPHADESIKERAVKFAHRNARAIWRFVAVACCIIALLVTVGLVRQARRNADLKAQDVFHSFAHDAEWLTIALTSPVVNDRDFNAATARSEYWIEQGPAVLHALDETRRKQMSGRLGELATALADVRLRQAILTPDPKSAAEEAVSLNRRAQAFFFSARTGVVLPHGEIEADVQGTAAGTPQLITEPKTAMGFKLLAQQQLDQRRPDQALIALQKANELSPRDYSIWAQLGYVHRALGDYQSSESCFSMCVALRNDLGLSYFQRGAVRLENQRHELAEEDFDHYLKLHPGDAGALFNRALARKTQGKLNEALIDLEAAAATEAPETRIWLLLADVRHTLNDTEGGENAFQRGLSTVPKDEPNWLARGMGLLRRGEMERAITDFRGGLGCNPQSIDARKNLAHVWSDHLDTLDDAIQIMTEAIEIQPMNAELRASRAVLLARAGIAEIARDEIAMALKQDRSVPTLVRAGCVYALTKADDRDGDLAVQYIRSAVALDPRWARMVAMDQDLTAVRELEAFPRNNSSGHDTNEVDHAFISKLRPSSSSVNSHSKGKPMMTPSKRRTASQSQPHGSRLRGRRLRRPLSMEALETKTLLDSGGVSAFLSLSFAPDGTQVSHQSNQLFQVLNQLAPAETWQRTIEQAFNLWAVHTNADIARVPDNGDPLGIPGQRFADDRFGDVRVAAVPLADSVLAISFPWDNVALGTWSSDIIFNSNHAWGSLDEIASVALHEAGHIFGLEHSNDASSAMHVHGISNITQPSPEDIAELQHLFGSRAIDPHEDEFDNDDLGQATVLSEDLGGEGLSLSYGDISTYDDVDVFRIASDDEIEGNIFVRVETMGPKLVGTCRQTAGA